MAEFQKTTTCPWLAFGLFAIILLGVLPAALAQQQYDGSLYSGLHWRMIGHFAAGA